MTNAVPEFIEEEETAQIRIETMRELVYGRPVRRSRLPALVTFALLGALASIGCGDNEPYSPADSGTDACVAASGNCGCVLIDTITHPDGSPNFVRVDNSSVVCP